MPGKSVSGFSMPRTGWEKASLRNALESGIADKDTDCQDAARMFIDAIKKAMKKLFEMGNTIKEISKEDIPKLARYADKEENPLYPVPVLMDAREREKFYYLLLEPSEGKEKTDND